MKYEDLPAQHTARMDVLRQALQPLCDALPKCSISSWWPNNKATISIKDWRCTRKWNVLIDDHAKSIKILYNKTEVCTSDDFDVICEEIKKHNEKLAERYDKIKIDRAKKEGDVAPLIMEIIRKKALPLMEVHVQSDTMMSIRYDPSRTTTIHGITIHIIFNGRKIQLNMSNQLGGARMEFDMADPSFNPEEWADWIMVRSIDTTAHLAEAEEKNRKIWTT